MRSKALLAALLCALSISSVIAQSAEQAECDRIRAAADIGRTRAIDRLNTLETTTTQQAVQMRRCMERFGDTAARQTVAIGGIDLTPLRNAIFESACNMIQGRLGLANSTSTLTPLNQVMSQFPQTQTFGSSAVQTFGNLPIQTARPVQSTVADPVPLVPNNKMTAPTAGGPSLWDKMSCTVTGRC